MIIKSEAVTHEHRGHTIMYDRQEGYIIDHDDFRGDSFQTLEDATDAIDEVND